MGIELKLENTLIRDQFLRIRPDIDSVDLVAFQIQHIGEGVNFCGGEESDGGMGEFFHLDKSQTGYLIDYLKRMYDNMDQ